MLKARKIRSIFSCSIIYDDFVSLLLKAIRGVKFSEVFKIRYYHRGTIVKEEEKEVQ
jgi:hypothetical protein